MRQPATKFVNLRKKDGAEEAPSEDQQQEVIRKLIPEAVVNG